MVMLADQVEVVIGVDTHSQSHTAAVVDRLGGVHATVEFSADRAGYRRVLHQADGVDGVRVWAVEGTGSYGAGLTEFLHAAGERVVEVERPSWPARRHGAKSDAIDAVRAAREVLARTHQIEPRRRGDREAIRVLLSTRHGAVVARTKSLNHLHALIVTAPIELREQLTGLSGAALVRRCAALRIRSEHSVQRQATVRALRSCARRVVSLGDEAADLEAHLELVLRRPCPGIARRTRHRTDQCRRDLPGVVARGSSPQRGRVRVARRRRTDPRILRSDRPSSPQPWRRPSTQPRVAHHRRLTTRLPRRDPRLRGPPPRRGQNQSRDPPLPQATRRPTRLQTPRTHRLTSIEASSTHSVARERHLSPGDSSCCFRSDGRYCG